jgi:hypothetical protein
VDRGAEAGRLDVETRRTHAGWPRVVRVQDSAGLRGGGGGEDARANPQATEEAPLETKPGAPVVASARSGSSVASRDALLKRVRGI